MHNYKEWLAPDSSFLPDFIIGGAMKSGTSTLHYILNEHEDIFIPDKEIGFFDIDNIIQHPDFLFSDNRNVYYQNIAGNKELFWNWYKNHFTHSDDKQLIGEDSTTYLASREAAYRIGIQNKDIKVIVMLRQPTLRAYSQYWHMVRTGRAIYNFENTLKYNPDSILNRSMYYDQIYDFKKYIKSDNIKIVLFEEYIKNPKSVIDEILEFIGVENKLNENVYDANINSFNIPYSYKFNLLKNKLLRRYGNSRYISNLPIKPPKSERLLYNMARIGTGLHNLINPKINFKKPPINPETKKVLDEYFLGKLSGLNELIDKDVMSLWFNDNINDK